MASIVGRDMRTTTGSNLKLLEESTGLDPWIYGSGRLKEELLKQELVEVPETDRWRVEYLGKLLEQRQQQNYLGEEYSTKELSTLIDSLCIN